MKKGDKVEFSYWVGKFKFRLIGRYLGNNGLAHIVKKDNVYYWLGSK